MPNGMSDGMPHGMLKFISIRTPHSMPSIMKGTMSKYMSNRMPERMSDRMPNKICNGMPEKIPNRI